MARRASPEADIQVALLKHVNRHKRPGVFAFAVPNGGYRSVTEAVRMKGQGVVAGVPDLVFVIEGRAHFLELKAGKAGHLSANQIRVHRQLDEAGAPVATAHSKEEAVAILEAWGAVKAADGRSAA